MFLHLVREDWSDCAKAQTDLKLPWAYVSEGAFSYFVAHITLQCTHGLVCINQAGT